MKDFITELKFRNETLFYFGLTCFFLCILFLVLSQMTSIKIAGVNAWYKPLKFALSIALYSITIAWYVHYLPSFNTSLFSWTVVFLLGFELEYIAIQAFRGQLSHFNISNGFYAGLYGLMAVAASVIALYTAYIGILFSQSGFPDLPPHYLWSIRIAIFLFVIFSFEGFVMGSRMSHTIGGVDGGTGLPLVNWSNKYGDPRIAHFIGMHALQVLPILSYYVLRNTKATIVAGTLYGLLAVFTLVQALYGKPYHRF